MSKQEYVWWDTEAEPEQSDPFYAESFDDAIRKAAWLCKGEIGEQLEYEMHLAVKAVETEKIREAEVRIVYSDPEVHVYPK